MKTRKKTLKAKMLSAAMAALMLSPMTMNAQYREDQYGLQEWGQTGLLGKQGGGDKGDGGIGLGGTTNEDPTQAPLGSGIAILVVAGVGYTLLKRKEDKQ